MTFDLIDQLSYKAVDFSPLELRLIKLFVCELFCFYIQPDMCSKSDDMRKVESRPGRFWPISVIT